MFGIPAKRFVIIRTQMELNNQLKGLQAVAIQFQTTYVVERSVRLVTALVNDHRMSCPSTA